MLTEEDEEEAAFPHETACPENYLVEETVRPEGTSRASGTHAVCWFVGFQVPMLSHSTNSACRCIMCDFLTLSLYPRPGPYLASLRHPGMHPDVER